ncbi:hypothetical protein [Prochlorococcus sp. MIT 1307]|uniref:hypothetical protein n=1 Tax=Prochlorococcus sp. MIT 1307 TaxID=3096219 RepID=UPI002A763D60|nr:hypothetical protein [Prochlorococcus sp. MIT 1307]
MKARTDSPDWVQGLRTHLRDNLSPHWQVIERKGRRACLGIRLEDGSRIYRNLPAYWERAQEPRIRKLADEIFELHMVKKVPLDEAIERVKKTNSDGPRASRRPNPKLLITAWESYGNYKVKVSGDVSQKTWDVEYGKTFRRLKEVAASNANDLLIEIGKQNEPGSRSRQIKVQHIAAFLRWATSKASNHFLPADNWTPPPKNALGDYVGRKSAKKQQESSNPTVVIEDEDLKELLNSLPIDIDKAEKKHLLRDRAMKWDLALKLAIVYGLRPIEVSYDYLEIKKNGKDYLFCTYCKKAGGGITKPRRLWPLHPEWEKEWKLIERIKRKDPLPRMKAGAGDAFKNYLGFNPVWKRLKAENGVVPYSFRHSYSKRGHQVYKLSDTEMAAFMGHTVQVHNAAYAQWSSESMLEASMERGIRYRDLTSYLVN